VSVPSPGAAVRLRVLVIAFGLLAVIFTGTTFLARWYRRERLIRAHHAFVLGESLEAKGRGQEAIELFRDALSVTNRPEYQLAMAQGLIKLGRLDEASLYLHEILQHNPSEAYPNLLLARIAVDEKNDAQAINYYQRAIYGRWSSEPEAHSLDARWELAGFLIKTGRNKAATAELLQLGDQARTTEARIKAATMLLDLHSPNQAADLFREVLKTQPLNTAALAGLGRAEMALGDYRQARNAFASALRRNPADSQVRASLSQADAILALDPTERGLPFSERYARSRRVLQRALSDLLQCGETAAVHAAAQKQIDAANALLRRSLPHRGNGAAEEANLAMAEQLWDARRQACGPNAPPDEVLERVLARIAK
jgi:tetratricopeptide (TPR) repeat protein